MRDGMYFMFGSALCEHLSRVSDRVIRGTLTGEKTCFLNSILKRSMGLFVQSKTRSEFSVWIAGTQSTKHLN